MKTSAASCLRDHARVGCRDGCREQLRRQEDQDTQRAREHIMPLVNKKKSMGLWVREGRARAEQQGKGRGGKRELQAESRPAPAVNGGQIVNKSTKFKYLIVRDSVH